MADLSIKFRGAWLKFSKILRGFNENLKEWGLVKILNFKILWGLIKFFFKKRPNEIFKKK